MNGLIWIAVIALSLAALVIVFLFQRLIFNLWVQALFSGASVSMGQLIGMRLRRSDARQIVYARIRLKQAGLEVSAADLEKHHLAGGDVERVAQAMIAARSAGVAVDLKKAEEIDLAGAPLESPADARSVD